MPKKQLLPAQRVSAQDTMRSCSLFKHLPDADVATLLDHMRLVALDRNEGLFKEGENANEIFLLESGYLKLIRTTQTGKEKIVEFVSPGETFAEALMFTDSAVFPVTSVALEPTQVWCISAKRYVQILRTSPDACFSVMGELSRRLHTLLFEINSLTSQSATVRLAGLLLKNASNSTSCEKTVHLSYPKTALASRLSIKPETLSRILSKLEKDNIICCKDKSIALLDIPALQRIFQSEQ